MRKSIWHPGLGILTLGLFLAGCAAVQSQDMESRRLQPIDSPPVEPNPLRGTEWLLVSYGSLDHQQSATSNPRPILKFLESTLDGNTGCNNYSSEYSVNGTTISFDSLFWTEMACPETGLMEQEGTYLTILSAIETFQLDDEGLTLAGPGGVLFFEPIIAPAERALVRRVWQLDVITNMTNTEAVAQKIPEEILITAWFEDRRIGGQTGCNHYSVPYQTRGTRLIGITGPLEMTQAGCANEERTNLEKRFIEALQAAEAYQVDGNRLTITIPSGELIFQSQEETIANESAVYGTILREWDSGRGSYVLLEETQFNKPGITVEETMEFVRSQVPPSGGKDPYSLDAETWANFEQKNASTSSLSERWHSELLTTFISETEIQEFFGSAQSANWDAFYQRFPGAQAIYTFSRVGFNQSGDQALVYFGILSEDFNGGYYHLLSKSDGLWSSVISFMIWGP